VLAAAERDRHDRVAVELRSAGVAEDDEGERAEETGH
jgi:hypothetical protein